MTEERLKDLRAAADLARRNPSQEWSGVVYAEDVGDLLAALDAARAERDEMRGNYERACQTIALMHEAATGRRGEAPRRGVVEDIADLRAQHLALLSRLEALEQRYRRPSAVGIMANEPTVQAQDETRLVVADDLAALRREMGQ